VSAISSRWWIDRPPPDDDALEQRKLQEGRAGQSRRGANPPCEGGIIRAVDLAARGSPHVRSARTGRRSASRAILPTALCGQTSSSHCNTGMCLGTLRGEARRFAPRPLGRTSWSGLAGGPAGIVWATTGKPAYRGLEMDQGAKGGGAIFAGHPRPPRPRTCEGCDGQPTLA
jgi:hypothetical protein